jgi:Mg2+ and Co2+ transporter CorA
MYGEIAALQEAIQEIVSDAREAKSAGDIYDVLYDVQHHAKDLQDLLRQLSDIEAELETRLDCVEVGA